MKPKKLLDYFEGQDPLDKLADDWEQIELKRRYQNLKALIDQVSLSAYSREALGDAYAELMLLKGRIRTETKQPKPLTLF